MSGKIILNLAMSLDGYIADKNGGYDWISGDGDSSLNSGEKFDFEKFLSGIDVVLMGSACYTEGMHKPYIGKQKIYVATSKADRVDSDVEFIGGDIVAPIMKEALNGKNIYLFGGGVVIDPFLKADVIDDYIIGIIPVILGGGRPLFLGESKMQKLKLVSKSFEDGVVMLQYKRRK